MRPIITAILCILVLTASARAGLWDGWTEDLRRGDTTPLASIEKAIDHNPADGARYAQQYWVPALMEAGRYDAAAQVAVWGIVGKAFTARDVEALMVLRTRALIQAKDYEAALQSAKGLFNVASSKGTGEALMLIAECLEKTHPNDPGLIDRFKREQFEGSWRRAEPRSSPIMASIRIVDTPFHEALRTRDFSHPDRGLPAKGNLLLLTGQADEAEAIFRRQYKARYDREYAERAAAAVKAQDGNVGRADMVLGRFLDEVAETQD